MAAFAGAMLVPFYLISPFVGYDFMLKVFVISIIGGLGSLPGAVLAGLMIGVVEALRLLSDSLVRPPPWCSPS